MSDWVPARPTSDEIDRRARLERYGLRLGQRHEVLDHLTQLASTLLNVPIALVSLVDADRQFFVSRVGLEAEQTGREESFCGHAIASHLPFRVPSSEADARFAGNPLVVGGPLVKAYLGVPLLAAPGQSAIGTLCVIDHHAREWTADEQSALQRLAAMAEHYIEGLVHRRAWDDSPLSMVVLNRAGVCIHANPALERMTGRATSTMLGRPLSTGILAADRGVLSAMLAYAIAHRRSPTRRELRFVKLSGEVIVGGTSMSPLSDLDDHVVCVIRDVSLERRTTSRSGVVEQVRAELRQPLDEARALLRAAEAGVPVEGDGVARQRMAEVGQRIETVEALLTARIGDIAARMRAEEALTMSEERLRSVVERAMGPLIVIDDHQRIVDVNSGALEALGWSYEELVGAPMRVVYPTFTEAECGRWYEAAGEARSAGAGVSALAEGVATFVRRDGVELRVELRWLEMDWNGPGRLVLIARDVTAQRELETRLRRERDDLVESVHRRTEALSEQQRMEDQLKRSLAEKETLLKEIHHRVKNNLQIVSSLLTLQREQLPDGAAREMMTESVHRVRSLALVHQHLYGSVSLEFIDLGAYTQNLAESLRSALAPHARVRVEAEPVEVTVERAVPFGLILNELLTNAFKYGVRPDLPRDEEHVVVQLTTTNQRLRLMVRDRGPGLPEGFSLGGGSSLGLQLVRALSMQLKAKVDTRSNDGAVFEVSCKL